jgi:hypothetical protein
MYTPDRWLIIKIKGDNPHYRVFGSWYGGYLGSDSWRMNSGITNVTEEDGCYLFEGTSGSTYRCHKEGYGISGYGQGVLDGMMRDKPDLIEVLPENTDITKLTWS